MCIIELTPDAVPLNCSLSLFACHSSLKGISAGLSRPYTVFRGSQPVSSDGNTDIERWWQISWLMPASNPLKVVSKPFSYLLVLQSGLAEGKRAALHKWILDFFSGDCHLLIGSSLCGEVFVEKLSYRVARLFISTLLAHFKAQDYSLYWNGSFD